MKAMFRIAIATKNSKIVHFKIVKNSIPSRLPPTIKAELIILFIEITLALTEMSVLAWTIAFNGTINSPPNIPINTRSSERRILPLSVKNSPGIISFKFTFAAAKIEDA